MGQCRSSGRSSCEPEQSLDRAITAAAQFVRANAGDGPVAQRIVHPSVEHGDLIVGGVLGQAVPAA